MKKVLVANRGEIAVRIMRTVHAMGLKSVAVYSDVDRTAPHVEMADEAVLLGGASPSESYLSIEKVLKAAADTGADAIHPGYGFLSENATFARAVEESGIIFIGPTAEAIEIMGSKLAAKEAVAQFDVPLVPGTDGAVSDRDEAARLAAEIGFPVLVKASAGGGGKGMRIVHSAAELPQQLERAQSEARNAFGDDSVFIEKYITSPRHIEIQILADKHGNVVHLGERECSIQRRHQKVVEEAPSPVVSETMRTSMGDAAIGVARSCGYVGAGTVEFIVDADLNYYFLEMNTRLQVEHPVTELVTGVDLVEQQIRIARGEKLELEQSEIKPIGHAIELRVYAEDPTNDFLPSIGRLTRYRIPSGPGIRVDDGLREDMDIPIHYDPMIAKLVVYADNRIAAIQAMEDAIGEYEIAGVQTTLPFGTFVMRSEPFRSGNFDTHFVQDHFRADLLNADSASIEVAARVAAKLQRENAARLRVESLNGDTTWQQRAMKD